MNENTFQLSDSFWEGSLLCIAAGSMDAYSFIFRGRVLASAQTGNLMMLGVNLSIGDFQAALRYFLPVLAFVVGIMLTDIARYKVKKTPLHWSYITIICEIILICITSTLSQDYNSIANALTSLACGIQVEAFRLTGPNQVATTMCIGNLRNTVYYTQMYVFKGDKEDLKKAGLYIMYIVFFVLGAVIENLFILSVGQPAILFSAFVLILAILNMEHESKKAFK